MPPLTIALLAFAALCAGTVDAIAGGGGLITVPALLTAGIPPLFTLGTNKGGSTWGSFAALVSYWRADRVDRRQAVFTFPLAFGGSLLGVALVQRIPPTALRPIVIVLLLGAAVVLMVRKPGRDVDDPSKARPTIAAWLAVMIGAYDGFFGPGTGTFLVVGFVALCGKSLSRATADAKVVNFAANLAALVSFAIARKVVWEVALPMAAGQLTGGVIGAKLAIRGGAGLIRGMVLVVSGALVIKLGVDLIR